MALHQIVKPQYEARHDFDIFAGLCKRFDKEAVYRENRNEIQWIQALYDEGVKMGASLGVTLPDFTTFWQGDGYIRYPPGQPWVRHGEFREQPDLNPRWERRQVLLKSTAKPSRALPMRIDKGISCGWNPLSVPIAAKKINTRYICNPAIRINVCIPSCAQARRFATRMPLPEESRFISARRMPPPVV